MTARTPIATRVRAAVAESLAEYGGDCGAGRAGGVLLAISGGRDSMVLLHAAVASAPDAVRAVATFDHGTGPHAERAVALVRSEAAALGVAVASGVAASAARTEAEWREARWAFLREAAAARGCCRVATAHTADDQLETVAMRLLRGAGARGAAALAARSDDVVRPILAVPRAAVAAYAAVHGLRWVDDPSNADRRHLRVRLRSDLLPALGRVRPGVAEHLLAAGAHAAAWRAAAEAWAAPIADDSATVSALAALDADALAVFWPVFAARASVRLDRRAVARLVAFTAHVARRVADGTVQPACVPVAGDAVVELVYAADPIGAKPARRGGRAWRFLVRPRSDAGASPERVSWRGGTRVA